MLLLVLILVAVAFGLLLVALATGTAAWAWISVVMSVAAAGVLVYDWAQRRAAVKSGGGARAAHGQFGAPTSMPTSLEEPPTTALPMHGNRLIEPATEVLPAIRPNSPGVPPVADAPETVAIPQVSAPSGSADRPSSAEPFGGNQPKEPSHSVTSGGDGWPEPAEKGDAAPSGDTAVGREPAEAEAEAKPADEPSREAVGGAALAAGAAGAGAVAAARSSANDTSTPASAAEERAAASADRPGGEGSDAAGRADESTSRADATRDTLDSGGGAERTTVLSADPAADQPPADQPVADQDQARQRAVGAEEAAGVGRSGVDAPAGHRVPDAAGGQRPADPAGRQGVDAAVAGEQPSEPRRAGGVDASQRPGAVGAGQPVSAAQPVGDTARGDQPAERSPDEQPGSQPDRQGAEQQRADQPARQAADQGQEAAGQEAATQAIPRTPAPAREPDEEPASPTAAQLVASLSDDVVVIDERPRYHLPSCRFLAGQETIPLPAKEAVEYGFTPCALCAPVRTLAARNRAASSS